MKPFRKALSVYWQFSRQYPGRLVLSVCIMLGNVVTSVSVPLIIGAITNHLLKGYGPDEQFWKLIGLLGLASVIGIGMDNIGRKSLEFMIEESGIKLERYVLAHILRLPYHFHTNSFAGSLVSQTNRFRQAYWNVYETVFSNALPFAATTITSIVVLSRYSPAAALTFLALAVVFSAVSIRLSRQRTPLRHASNQLSSKQTGTLADILSNILTVKFFAHEATETERYKNATQEWMYAERKSFYKYLNNSSANLLLGTILQISTLLIVALSLKNHAISAGLMIIVFAYSSKLIDGLFKLGDTIKSFERAITDSREMSEILLTMPDVTDAPNARVLDVQRGEIALKEVNYTYPKTGKQLFSDLSLVIKPGSKVGLVGPSGGGKTTLTKLLLRLFDPQSGEILIDNQALPSVTETSLRQAIAYVPQEPLLFHRSIAENIGYGKPGASQAEIEHAAMSAHAHEFIGELPNGYETLVGERGVKLSGGQRQRVAIARAILKDAPILIFDEATSALDSESEKLIQDALFKLMEGRTSIVIAHRLSTVKHLDRIIVMEHGRVTEDGKHAELVKKSGTYARLWSHQSGS